MTMSEDRTVVRDAALARISRTRRWALAGTAALTAGLAALASALLPGKSFGAGSPSTAKTAGQTATASPALPAPANAAELGVGGSGQGGQSVPAPQAAPSPQPAAPAAVSGGS